MNKLIFVMKTIVVGFIIQTSNSWAGCTSGNWTYTDVFPETTFKVSRNQTPGTKIGAEISVKNGKGIRTTCTSVPAPAMIKFGSTMTSVTVPGVTGVFATNIPGIGIKVWDNFSGSLVVSNDAQRWYNLTGLITDNFLTGIKMQFYITGPVDLTQGNEIKLPEPFVETWANTSLTTSGGTNYNTLNMPGKIKVEVRACKTPDIKVDLGKHSRSDFANLNATSAATPFTFAINDCDPKMNSVHYTFKPAPGITVGGTGANQHITLDSSSTARGFGIQVLYDSGAGNTPVPLNTKTQFTGYSTSATTTRSYTIPMKARFIRTASNAADVSGGSASSAIEFTMSYE